MPLPRNIRATHPISASYGRRFRAEASISQRLGCISQVTMLEVSTGGSLLEPINLIRSCFRRRKSGPYSSSSIKAHPYFSAPKYGLNPLRRPD